MQLFVANRRADDHAVIEARLVRAGVQPGEQGLSLARQIERIPPHGRAAGRHGGGHFILTFCYGCGHQQLPPTRSFVELKF